MRVTSVPLLVFNGSSARNSLRVLLVPLGCAIHVLRKCLLSTLFYLQCLFKGCVCVRVCVCVCVSRGRERERAILVLLAYNGRF